MWVFRLSPQCNWCLRCPSIFATYFGSCLPTFRDKLSVLSPGVKRRKNACICMRKRQIRITSARHYNQRRISFWATWRLKTGPTASVNNCRHTVLWTLGKTKAQSKLTAFDVWSSSCIVTRQHESELLQKETKITSYLIWGMLGTFLLRIYTPIACLKTWRLWHLELHVETKNIYYKYNNPFSFYPSHGT